MQSNRRYHQSQENSSSNVLDKIHQLLSEVCCGEEHLGVSHSILRSTGPWAKHHGHGTSYAAKSNVPSTTSAP